MDAVITFAVIPATVGLVNILRGLGVPRQWLPVLSVVIGIVLQTAHQGISVDNVLLGLVLGLSASGSYDMALTVGNPKPTAAVSS